MEVRLRLAIIMDVQVIIRCLARSSSLIPEITRMICLAIQIHPGER